MIIKNKDNKQDSIDYLTDLLDRDFADEKKGLIEREIKNLYSANIDEGTSAYYLGSKFKQSKDWVLIHDFRLEHASEIAQIDHLLIGRAMDVYVIDSKSFTYDVVISEDGDFSYFYKNNPYSIPSPITQNQQNINLLNKFLTDNDLLPKRLGMTLTPAYKNIVLLSSVSKMTKPGKGLYDCSAVMKTDKFSERFNNELDNYDVLGNMDNLAKVVSQDSLLRFAEKIVLHHKPFSIDYVEKFGLNSEVSDLDDTHVEAEDLPLCPVCGKQMVKREAKKGKSIGKIFYGCSQFPKCRGVLEVDSVMPEEAKEEPLREEENPVCPKCNGLMVKRVSKKGDNAGREFWGCKNFPKCRGVVSIKSTLAD